MAPDPRLSDRELAAINAAAVTQEFRVQPHLGGFEGPCRLVIEYLSSTRLSHSISHQWASRTSVYVLSRSLIKFTPQASGSA